MPAGDKMRQNKDGEWEVTTEVMTSFLGVSAVILNKWAKNGCPKSERGWWNVKAVLRWRGLSREGDSSEQTLVSRKLEAEADYKHAKARQEELTLLKMMGELVPREMVQATLAETFTGIRQTLLMLPSKIRTELHTAYPEISVEVASIAENNIRGCLTGLSGADNSKADRKMGRKSKAKRK